MKVSKQTARKDIYQCGARIKADNKQGFVMDRSKPWDANDKVIIPAGSNYYSWKFRNGQRQVSLTYPKPQQLTQSEFLINVYNIKDLIDEIIAEGAEGLESIRDSIVEEINNLRDEVQERFDNIPENLQSAPVAELLQERIDALDGWSGEIENVDLSDFDEEDGDLEKWIQEKIDEIQQVEINI